MDAFLSLLVRNSVYTYTLTLCTVLLGIVLGSVATAGLYDRLRRRALIFGGLQVLAGLSVLAAMMLPAEFWTSHLAPAGIRSSWWVFVVVLLPPATLSGAAFPLVTRLVVDRPALAAAGVGRLLAVNTAGGIAGSLIVGFCLLPLAGLHVALLVTTGLSLLIGGVGQAPGLTEARLDLLSSNEAVRQDLQFAYWGGPDYRLSRPAVLLAGFLAGPEALARIAAGAPIYHDDRPTLEYTTSQTRPTQEVAIVDLIRANLDPIEAVLAQSAGAERMTSPETIAQAEMIRDRNLADIVAAAFKRAATEGPPAGGLPEQVELLQTANGWNPDNVEINRLLNDAYLLQGRSDLAMERYSTAVGLDPGNAPARRALGRAMLLTGRVPEAIEQLSQAVRLDPASADAHNNLGTALGMQNRFDEAIEHLSEATRLEPRLVAAQANLARALAHQGRLREAVDRYRTVIRLDPDNASAHRELGLLLAQRGETDEAQRMLGKAMALDPASAEIRSNYNRLIGRDP